MRNRHLLFAVLVSMLRVHVGRAQEDVWSGLANEEGDRLDYLCPDSLALSGVASDFVTSDRQWEFLCTSANGLANVSLTCELQTAINTLQSDINFDCPDNGYLAGFVSEYDSSNTDRVWQPYCCTRPFATLINCQKPTSSWENALRDNLNFTAPDSQVIAGVESFYFNRDRRWRFRTCDVVVDCEDPGVPDNAVRAGDNFLYNSTVTFTCNNGYYQSSGPVDGTRRCLDSGLWSENQPVCSSCTPIANCADIRCTNSSDQYCFLCESNNGAALGERAYTNLHTECQPKCSWLTTFCYPGNCPDLPSSCNCSAGFEGSACLEISGSPELTGCEVMVVGEDGSTDMLPCQPNTTSPLIYTNIVPYQLLGTWGVVYTTPTPPPARPAYVDSSSVGVATSEIQVMLYRASNPATPVSMTTHPCEDEFVSRDMPISGMIDCSVTATNLSAHTFLHGDDVEVRTVASAGGFLDILNLDSPPQSQRHYYNATPTIGRAVFILDLQPPTHCSLTPAASCSPSQFILSLSGDIVTSNQINVSWGGWVDTPSGVISYQLDVYFLEYSDGLLVQGDPLATNQTTHTGQAVYTDTVYLPREGPYSFVLQSHDLAGNTRYSRQALLYDSNSSVEIDPASPLTVVSAVPSTGYLWQNSSNRSIVISGIGHFYNTNLRGTNYLAPLANFSAGGVVEEDFDQALAQGRFPRAGTRNALGIVELRYDVIVDHMGGNSSESRTQPTSFPDQTSDLGLENVEIITDVVDGDSVRVWFRAEDFRFQYEVDSVLVHLDSSSPVMDELALEWNGVGDLSLHGTDSLLDLDVRFRAYDEHSGIFSIEWFIEAVVDAERVGSGRVLVPMLERASCSPPHCVCDPLHHCSPRDFSIRPTSSDFTTHQALHNTNYIVTVTVTNHALLSSTLSHVFTIDATPPLQGHVMDGNQSHDIDYQIHSELSAWWSGFFDHESDVMVYQYLFDTQCSNSTHFMYPIQPSTQAIQTAETMATWTAPSNGTYYVTVVAFNQALQPSSPLCSDGITIDTVAPEITEVVIPGAVVEPRLVRDVTGELWYVGRDRVRVWVGACPNATVPIVSDLTSYPIGYDGLPADVCREYAPSQLTYLIADHTLNVSWSSADNVGVARYEAGIVPEQNFTSDGRYIQYYHTAGQSHYSFHNSELLSNGNRFYLSIRVVDLAQQQELVNIGPILIDVTPPTFNGTLESVQSGNHVTVTWDENWFQDPESGVNGYEFAIGQTDFGIQVSNFVPLPLITPPECPAPFCVAIDTTTLLLLSGREYYVTIKATNQAGLASYVSTSFTHVSQLPTLGYVSDIDPRVTFDLTSRYSSFNEDVDVLIDSDLLAVSWGGFTHPNLPVSYVVGLGTEPGLDNIVPLTSIGMATDYVFWNVTLASGGVYYSVVIAENSVGRVNVSSNGVLVLRGVASSLPSAQVVDGLSPVDIDYQSSKTAVSAVWEFPEPILSHASHYEWTVLLEGSPLMPYSSVGRDVSVLRSVQEMEEGYLYTSAVRACFPDLCLDPVLSDGFQISIPPVAGLVRAVYTPLEMNEEFGVSEYGSLDVTWELFEGPQITHYEWSVGNGNMGTELLVYWTPTDELSLGGILLNASISLHKPNYISVRGYNSAGFYSMSTSPLEWNVDGEVLPQQRVPRSPLAVFDITESDVPLLLTDNWKDIEHVARAFTDIDYTGSAHSLSAVWPDLRYTAVSYSLSTQQLFTTCEGEPYAVTCGTTIASGVTVTNLDLVDGERYYFCVQGLISDAIHPTANTPPTVKRCSNGITVDLTPPISGCVQIITLSVNESDHLIGSGVDLSSGLAPVPDNIECTGNGTGFMVSSSDVFVVWEEFRDVENGRGAVHVTGVKDYQYAIGTSPGGNDVVDFTSVGVATYAVVRDLSLESGLTYYATIRGSDFVGHVTDAYSQAVTVDTTPPDSVRVWVEGGGSYADDGLGLNWERPVDDESGVAALEWALGSRPGSSDIVEWRSVNVLDTSEVIDGDMFQDGHTLFLSLKVTNGAGVSSISSSFAHLLDGSPPSPGLVYDGPSMTAEISDLDYSTDLSMLSSHWTQFSDPHTTVVEYFVAVGTEPGGTDVQDTISVGIATDITLTSLTLSHGHTYHTTVTACNALGLCSSASSNGITIDVTPPIPGKVLSGYTGVGAQFQASRTTLSAHWTGFYDDESSIKYFTYHIGLSPNDSSIVAPVIAPPTQTSFVISAPTTLPTRSTLYTTVNAVNGAGVRVQTTSSGIYIDDTPPEVVSDVAIVTRWAGSVDMATQYSTTAVRAEWSYSDSLSTVNQHFWSFLSASNVRNPIPGRMVGSQSHTTATNLNIQDGDTHSVILIGCDQAGLCSHSMSDSVLFDSSPPIDGYFGTITETRAVLNRTVPGGMTWRNRNLRGYAELNIAFLGFNDPHSGVSEYWIAVGTSYSTADLMPSSQPEMVAASLASEERGVYLTLVSLSRVLAEGEELYVSMWAVNGVGLKSHTIHGTFTVDPRTTVNNNGTLTLVPSSICPLSSCLTNCSCGVRGLLCVFRSETPCTELDSSTLPPARRVVIRALSPQLTPGANDSTLYTAVTDKLVAEWELVEPTSNEFQHLEWSVSEEGFSPGEGVVGVLESGPWMGVDGQTELVFSNVEPLRQGVGYVFHLRAWYSDTSYALFTSNTITVDTVGMETILGERVRVVGTSQFISDPNALELSLDNLFSPSLSGGLATFQVAIGDSLYATNILDYTPVSATSTSLPNFDLQDGRTYYVTAQAVSPLDVITTSISLPLTVDLTPPTTGHMFTGRRTHDVLAQTNSISYSARWLGFSSPLSGIRHYELALTQSTATPTPSEFSDVGISLRGTLESLILNDGERYFPHLVAVSDAGVRSSDFVLARGLVLDTSPPIGLPSDVSGINLLDNPSFEGISAQECSLNTSQATEGWRVSGDSTVLTPYHDVLPYDGCNALLFAGTLSQSVSTQPGLWHRVSLAIHRFTHTAITHLTVSLPGASSVCALAESGWTTCELLFMAENISSTLELATPPTRGVVVDAVSIVSLTEYSEARNGTSVPNRPSNVIRIGMEQVIGHSRVRIHAHWLIVDPESGIRTFQWAVGTVEGGQQKQSYRSTGTRNSGVSEELVLRHNEMVFVGVAAENFAGLSRVFYSQPFIVDLTPPTSNGSVLDGDGSDRDYQREGVVWADWSEAIRDGESGLVSCLWALGTSRGASDLQLYTTIPRGITSSHSNNLSPLISHGDTVYSTVKCLNGAGRYGEAFSDGVTILTTPPNATWAYSIVTSPEPTFYDTVLDYLPSNSLVLTWNGFADSAGTPLEYEVRVTNGSGVVGDWENVGFLKQLTLNDIELPGNNSRHVIQVRAVNLAGVQSEAVSREFFILPTPPIDSGVRVNDTWLSRSQLLLDWTGKFSSPAPLRYELSVGTQRGSGSILRWMMLSSERTSITLSHPRLERSSDYYLTLTAIAASGLHTRHNQVIAGIPLAT